MPVITVKLQTAVRRTFRVEQVAGMFDVPLGQVPSPRSKVERRGFGAQDGEAEGTRDGESSSSSCPSVSPALDPQSRNDHLFVRHTLTAEVPGVEEKWTIGAI